jgi:flagellar biosynthetic protein FliR
MPPTTVLELPFSADVLSVFLLVLARTVAWTLVVPLFAAKGVPSVARIAIAASLALFLTPLLYPHAAVPDGTTHFAIAVAGQVAIGLALGLLTALVLSAIDVAGSLADYASGFSYGAMLDPVSGAQSSAFGRLTSITFMSLLMVTDGYRTIIAGFVSSFRALPLDHLPTLSDGAGPLLGAALVGVFVAALQIGAPMLGVLFLTEVALALAGRFVPQANALTVGLPIKSLVSLTAAGTMLAMLPGQIPGLVEPAVRLGGLVIR